MYLYFLSGRVSEIDKMRGICVYLNCFRICGNVLEVDFLVYIYLKLVIYIL